MGKHLVTEVFADNVTCEAVVQSRMNTVKDELSYSAVRKNSGSCGNYGSSGDEATIKEALNAVTPAKSISPAYTTNCDYCSASMKVEAP